MIEDAGKKEKCTLPMILEETQRSTESISTLAFDTLTLTSLEDELFEDIRASIQKSRKTSSIQTFGSEAGQSFSKAHAHPCESISTFSDHYHMQATFLGCVSQPYILATYFHPRSIIRKPKV